MAHKMPPGEGIHRIGSYGLVAGLAGTDHVVVDGTPIKADVNKQRCVKTPGELPRSGEGATRAVREHLADLDDAMPGPWA